LRRKSSACGERLELAISATWQTPACKRMIAPVLGGDDDVLVRVHGELAIVKIVCRQASGVRIARAA